MTAASKSLASPFNSPITWIVNGSLAVGAGRVTCSGLTVRKWTGPSGLAAAIEKNAKGAVIFPQAAGGRAS
jgi:hypothetical protein